jgi:hypothetical protein
LDRSAYHFLAWLLLFGLGFDVDVDHLNQKMVLSGHSRRQANLDLFMEDCSWRMVRDRGRKGPDIVRFMRAPINELSIV